MYVDRRSLLLMLAAAPALARGRAPIGGKLALRVPWPLATIDPHAIDDAASALFASALFDTLYAWSDGKIVPALAEAEPETSGGELRVRVRAGVTTAQGRALTARDAVSSITRAKGLGAGGWLADVPVPRRDEDALVFALRDKDRLTSALASPLTAIVPIGFSPARPDGTGAFKLEPRAGGVALVRNDHAARGPSFLDEIAITAAPDLAASLRAFEAGSDDLGWLGLGLHGPRSGSKPFDAGHAGFTILRTGKLAAAWDAPGIAQRLCDGMDPVKLAYLVPGAPWTQAPDTGWGGAPCELIVRSDAPYLIEVARAVAALLSRPGHEVKVTELAPPDFATKRASKSFALAVDVARAVSPGALGAMVGLATADDVTLAADIVRHPPRLAEAPARALTRTMRVGVIGEIRVQGGRMDGTNLPSAPSGFGWDLAGATRGERR